LLSKPHEYWRWRDHTTTYSEFQKGNVGLDGVASTGAGFTIIVNIRVDGEGRMYVLELSDHHGDTTSGISEPHPEQRVIFRQLQSNSQASRAYLGERGITNEKPDDRTPI
jgi:hypothetical protein